MKRLMIPVLALLVSCATYELPEHMVVTETHYTDAQALAAVCGGTSLACVFTDEATYCNLHLPLAANMEPMYRWHEITHCAGRKDQPSVNRTF